MLFFCSIYEDFNDFFLLRKKILENPFAFQKNFYLCTPYQNGVVAQLVEQRTENPCVTGSIPVDTTTKKKGLETAFQVLFSFIRARLFRARLSRVSRRVTSPNT